MCRVASFILSKDREFWSKTSDSHEEIIAENKLVADGATGPNILRVEVSPAATWHPLSSWVYRVDQDILPKWADAAKDEARARAALKIRLKGIRLDRLKKYGGSLDLSGTAVKELPAGLTSIGGSLDLSGTAVKELPAGLTSIGGSLNLSGTAVKELPAGLTSIGGSLNLYGTAVK